MTSIEVGALGIALLVAVHSFSNSMRIRKLEKYLNNEGS